MLNLLCSLTTHRWEHVSSNVFERHTERNWECKRCSEKHKETVWHEL